MKKTLIFVVVPIIALSVFILKIYDHNKTMATIDVINVGYLNNYDPQNGDLYFELGVSKYNGVELVYFNTTDEPKNDDIVTLMTRKGEQRFYCGLYSKDVFLLEETCHNLSWFMGYMVFCILWIGVSSYFAFSEHEKAISKALRMTEAFSEEKSK